jgi:hypothetical protein
LRRRQDQLSITTGRLIGPSLRWNRGADVTSV